MSYETDYELMTYRPLVVRATPAVLEVARDIINESPATPNHINRLAWANSMIDRNAAEAQVQRSIVWMVTNPTLSSAFASTGNIDAIDDSAMKFIIINDVLPHVITPAA